MSSQGCQASERGGRSRASRVYDPTNGTVSGGDMVRVIGDTGGLQEAIGG